MDAFLQVQREIFDNRLEEEADCELGDPDNEFPMCSEEASGTWKLL